MKKALLFLATALFVVATSNAVFAKEAAPTTEAATQAAAVKGEEVKDGAEVQVKEEGKPEEVKDGAAKPR